MRLISLDIEGGEVPLRTIGVNEHAEYEGSTRHAWRARSWGGQLLLELRAAPVPSVAGPVVVHILECARQL